MAFQFSPKIVTDGLVLYLDASNTKSYPGSGTVWYDLSRRGFGLTASLVSGPTFSGVNGGVIAFDGVDDYVTVPNSTLWDFLGSFSLECWVYVNSYDTLGTFFIHQQSGGFEFHVTNANVVRLNANGGTNMASSTASFSIGRWNHVVATYEGTTAKIYLNTSNIATNVSASPPSNVTGQLRIGSYVFFGSYELNGKMSCVRIYNGKALSVSEVIQNYNATKSRFGL